MASEQTEKPAGPRAASYLSPPHLMRLSWACVPVKEAFGRTPYLVGSALLRPDYRDIDIRLILDDDDFCRMFAAWGDGLARLRLVNSSLSLMIETSAKLGTPIDFQIQPQSHANTYDGMRNPLGMRRAGGVDVPMSFAEPEADR